MIEYGSGSLGDTIEYLYNNYEVSGLLYDIPCITKEAFAKIVQICYGSSLYSGKTTNIPLNEYNGYLVGIEGILRSNDVSLTLYIEEPKKGDI